LGCSARRSRCRASSRAANRPGAARIDLAQPLVKETSVDLPGQSNQRMAHVDDLLKGRPEQIRLPIIPRSRHPDPQCRIPQRIESEIGQTRNPKSQENSLLNRAFLQKSLLARAD